MINSTSNKQVKRVANLRDKAKARREEGLYVAEALRMCREYKPDDVEILYITENFGKQEENKKWLRGFKFEFVTDEVMHYMADTKTPQGVLAVAKQKKCTMEDILKKTSTPKLIMILENIQDPGNLGTIFRTAEAAGATGILLSSDSVDVYNPKVIRSTMGAVFRMPFFYVKDLPAAVKSLSSQGIRTYAAHLNGKNVYDEEDYTEGCAFLIGNEGNGLRDEVSECADCLIRIPMCGQVESLNAAISTAVIAYEVLRQRSTGKK